MEGRDAALLSLHPTSRVDGDQLSWSFPATGSATSSIYSRHPSCYAQTNITYYTCQKCSIAFYSLNHGRYKARLKRYLKQTKICLCC